MKCLLTKTLTSTALVLVTLTSAQAQVRPSYLPYAPPLYKPAQLQYFAMRDAAIAKEVQEEAKGRPTPNPYRTIARPAYLPYAPPAFTPAQLQYWDEREAANRKGN